MFAHSHVLIIAKDAIFNSNLPENTWNSTLPAKTHFGQTQSWSCLTPKRLLTSGITSVFMKCILYIIYVTCCVFQFFFGILKIKIRNIKTAFLKSSWILIEKKGHWTVFLLSEFNINYFFFHYKTMTFHIEIELISS